MISANLAFCFFAHSATSFNDGDPKGEVVGVPKGEVVGVDEFIDKADGRVGDGALVA
jgi:hypothetical protein